MEPKRKPTKLNSLNHVALIQTGESEATIVPDETTVVDEDGMSDYEKSVQAQAEATNMLFWMMMLCCCAPLCAFCVVSMMRNRREQ